MRNKRKYQFEIIQVVLAVAVIVMTVILMFHVTELTILYPLIFGTAAVLAFIYALEGILYNRNRVTRKTRVIVFGLIALALVALTVLSAITISR